MASLHTVEIFAQYIFSCMALYARKYDVSEKKIKIVQRELTAICAKKGMRENASYGLMSENLAAQIYLRLQY